MLSRVITQFLDEADLLADNIAVLAAPGKLVAHGSPVTLKNSLGEGYSVHVKFSPASTKNSSDVPNELLASIRRLAPEAYAMASSSTQVSYRLRSKDPITVERVLSMLDGMKVNFGIRSYDVVGTNIEDIFLRLMTPVKHREIVEHETQSILSTATEDTLISTEDSKSIITVVPEPKQLTLTTGQPRAPLHQALVIFRKRFLIARRGWLSQLLLVCIAVAGSTVPTFFMSGRPASCDPQFINSPSLPLYLPLSPINSMSPFGNVRTANATPILTFPANIASALGVTGIFLPTSGFADNASLIQYIKQNFLNITTGGISVNEDTGSSLFAWETEIPGFKSSAMLNLVSNVLLNRGLQASGGASISHSAIVASYVSFPAPDSGLLGALKWVVFFGAAMVSIL
jgi:hypothetical protein